jgi:hypothetical protein
VAEFIVDISEFIDIDHQRKKKRLPDRGTQFIFDISLKPPPVIETREDVGGNEGVLQIKIDD